MSSENNTDDLVNIKQCLEAVFPNELIRPSIRTFYYWRQQGKFPFYKIGQRTYYKVDEVRKAVIVKRAIPA